MSAIRIALLVLIVAGAAPRADAQPRDRGGPTEIAPERRARIKERVSRLRAGFLVRALQLDDATAAALMPILARHDAELARLARTGVGLRRAIDDAIARGDDAATNRGIDELLANQRARRALEEARFTELRRVLTPAQAARLLEVLPAIDRRIHRQLRRAIDGRRPGGRRNRWDPQRDAR